ncbi:MAG: hypothetical protein JOS17DRAFT_807347 [Linnemannia elongata]|nr:MAG: hypothetical protein JOS17DRAFT_807347 [Linnemannia elongata]
MKISNVTRMTLLFSATVSAHRQEDVPTTLAIEVWSSATRLSVLAGDNGLTLGDNGEPVIVDRYNASWAEERVMAESVGRMQHQGIYSEQYRETSAAIFPFHHFMEYIRGILVYRLGSSTSEVSVLKVDGGSSYIMSSVSDQRLGEDDFKHRVVDHLLLAHKNKAGQGLHSDDMFLLRLGSEFEKAKRVLSVQDWTSCSQLAVREYFGRHKKYHRSNHPETTVVFGAAKLGHWFQDERCYDGEVCCFGESRRTLGIETAGDVIFIYTDRNSGRDINKIYTFSTAMDNQNWVVIRVFSGDGRRTNRNAFLGGVELTGIAPAPKGASQSV